MRWQDLREQYPYLYETHLHTRQGSACAKADASKMVEAAKEYGYTGIIVTEHNWGGNTCVSSSLSWDAWVDEYCRGYEQAKNTGDMLGLTVFFGMEAGFGGTEFLLYGISKEWLKKNPEIRQDTVETMYRRIQRAGGMMIHAHPFREEYYIPEIRLYPEYTDGVEGINAMHSNSLSHSHFNPEFDRQALEYAEKYDFPVTAGSDIHSVKLLGGGMAFKKRLETIDDYVRCVKGKEGYILTNGEECYSCDGKKI